jgi:hypothetical protein
MVEVEGVTAVTGAMYFAPVTLLWDAFVVA